MDSHCLDSKTLIKYFGPGTWLRGGFLQSGISARRPSGLQELLRHKVKVLEGSLLASSEGPLGHWWGQGRRQAGELSLEVTKVCRATEGRHEGRLDSAGQQGLPVGSLNKVREYKNVGTTVPRGPPTSPPHQEMGTAGFRPLTLKNG